MEEIYSQEHRTCKVAKARPETISFLLSFSKAYTTTSYQDITFDSVMN